MALGERCELSGELRDPGVRLGELRLGLGLGAGGAVALGRKRLHQLGVAGPFDFQLGGQGVNQGVRGGCSGRVGWLAGRFAGVLQGVGDVGDSALVEPDGDELVSQLGKRRWRVMGDPEDGWWVEVDSDGNELPGDWEYDRKGGYVYCSFS